MIVIQFQTTCLRLVFMSFILRSSERDRGVHLDALFTLLCLLSHASFLDFFWFHFETATKAKFIFDEKENGS